VTDIRWFPWVSDERSRQFNREKCQNRKHDLWGGACGRFAAQLLARLGWLLTNILRPPVAGNRITDYRSRTVNSEQFGIGIDAKAQRVNLPHHFAAPVLAGYGSDAEMGWNKRARLVS